MSPEFFILNSEIFLRQFVNIPGQLILNEVRMNNICYAEVTVFITISQEGTHSTHAHALASTVRAVSVFKQWHHRNFFILKLEDETIEQTSLTSISEPSLLRTVAATKNQKTNSLSKMRSTRWEAFSQAANSHCTYVETSSHQNFNLVSSALKHGSLAA